MTTKISLLHHTIQYDRCALSYKHKIEEFAKKTKNQNVLDVGCGFGNYTSLFLHSNNSVHGLDIEDLRLKEHKGFFHKLYDGYKFPYPSNFFDTVTCFDVIEHIKHDTYTISEIYRVLRPNGQVFLATPNRHRLASLIKILLWKKDKFPKIMQIKGIGGKSIHVREYTAYELHTLFKQIHFRNIHLSPLWLGLRGKINIGAEVNLFPTFAHTLFIHAVK